MSPSGDRFSGPRPSGTCPDVVGFAVLWPGQQVASHHCSTLLHMPKCCVCSSFLEVLRPRSRWPRSSVCSSFLEVWRPRSRVARAALLACRKWSRDFWARTGPNCRCKILYGNRISYIHM